MIGVAFLILAFGCLLLMANHVGGAHRTELTWCITLALVLRLMMMWLGADLPWFANGVEGDWMGYERVALVIARMWERSGVYYYMTDFGGEKIATISLPVNVFAYVFYLNGGAATRLGGTVVTAGLACLTGLNFYALAVQRGVPERTALRSTIALLFVPSIFLYSSHMYKDAMVLALTFGALAAAVRLSDKFSFVQLLVCFGCASLLWLVRHYLLFAVALPAAIGVIGLGSRSAVRQVTVAMVSFAVIALVANYTDLLTTLGDDAQRTFEVGTSKNVVDGNATGGSGIHFDDTDNPWAQIHLKLAYTLFSPFPWGGGSIAFQIGKLDGLFMCYSMYRIVRHFPRLWRDDRTVTALLVAFSLPMSLVYAAGVSNVGLIVRQRMPLTAIFALLALFTFRTSIAPPTIVPLASPRQRRTLAAR